MNFDKNKDANEKNAVQYDDDVRDLVVARLETLPQAP